MTQTNKSKGFVRMALMGTAFVALTGILIVFQPGSPRHALNEALPEASVTRVAPELDNISPTIEGTPGVVAVPQGAAETPNAATTQSTQSGAPSSMRDLTFVAISNLNSATKGETPAPGEPGSLLHSVVQRSLGVEPAQIEVQAEPATIVAQPIRRPKRSSYFVLPGDTLVSIAQEQYGDPTMASELFLKNADIMSRPDKLSVGMVLDLP